MSEQSGPEGASAPTLQQVQCWRYLMTAALRVLGGLLLVFSTVPLLGWMYEGTMDGDLFYTGYYGPRIVMGLAMIVSGIVLLAMGDVIARWVLPIPRPRCPGCQYPLRSGSPNCSECGLGLGPGASVKPPVRTEPGVAPPVGQAPPMAPPPPPPVED